MPKFSRVAAVNEIPPGAKKIVEVDGIEVVVVNLDGQFYAVEDVCTHDASTSAPAPPPGCRRSNRRRRTKCAWKMGMCW
jgi:nitrite reductase/ring-hydroxylating ferredoxin subunit